MDIKIHKQDAIYKGKVVHLNVDTITLPNGKEAIREVVRHPKACCIVPVMEKDKIVLIRQFRYATGDYIWEFPAGLLEKGEEPIECAKRELEEETGYSTGKIKQVLSFYSSPGYSDEFIYLFIARCLTQTRPVRPSAERIRPPKTTGSNRARPNLEDDEELYPKIFTIKEVMDMIKKGEIVDGKTIIGLYALML